MKIGVVLGKRLNDDGSITNILKKRLDMAIELLDNKIVEKLIVSGGVANKIATFSEAYIMREYLLAHNVSSEDIILEDESKTTVENALFSIPKAIKLGCDLIVICSTKEHFVQYNYNPIKIFQDALNEYKKNNPEIDLEKIRLMIYTDCTSVIND